MSFVHYLLAAALLFAVAARGAPEADPEPVAPKRSVSQPAPPPSPSPFAR